MSFGPHPLLLPWLRPSWLPKIEIVPGPEHLKGPCWLWHGARNSDGYAVVRGLGGRKGKLVYLHRLSLAKWLGVPLEDFEADHLCFLRNCFQPRHLEKCTKAENFERSSAHLYRFQPKDQLTPEDWLSLADTNWVYMARGYAYNAR